MQTIKETQTIKYTDSLFWAKASPFLEATEAEMVERFEKRQTTYEVMDDDAFLYSLYGDMETTAVSREDFTEQMCKTVESKVEEYIHEALVELMDNEFKPNITISTSHTANYKEDQTKISVHVYVSNVIATKQQQRRFMHQMNLMSFANRKVHNNIFDYIPVMESLFDESVYNSNAKMRCTNTSKPNECRPLVLVKGELIKTIITRHDPDARIMEEFNDGPQYTKSNFVSPFDNGITESPYTAELLFYAESGAFANLVGSGCHQKWLSLAGMLASVLPVEDAFTCWEQATMRDGTTNKQSEYEAKFNHVKKLMDDPLKAMNTLKKVIKRDYPTIAQEWKQRADIAKETAKQQLCDSIKAQKETAKQQLCDSIKAQKEAVKAQKEAVKAQKDAIEQLAYMELTDENKELLDSLTPSQMVLLNASIDNINDFDLATAFNALYGSNYVCTNNNRQDFYCFDKINNLWGDKCGNSPIRTQISTEFKSVYECIKKQMMNDSPEESAMKIKNIGVIMQRCGQSGDKDHIVKELSDLIKDTEFPDDMNKSLYMIPTNDNCVFDMRTLTSVPRTIEHKFDFAINAKYIPYDATIPEFGVVDKYFNDLFCGDTETTRVFIDVLKSVLVGKPLRFIFFCIGTGTNGKSTLFNAIRGIFNKFVDTLSNNVIVESGTKSALNTEIEKLDKSRIGLVSELSGITKLNESAIKAMTGGDGLNLRTLHTKDKTIYPTLTSLCSLNVQNMPSFDAGSKALLNRIVVFNFCADFGKKDENGEFVVGDQNAFEKGLLELSDYIFSYIMHFGTISSSFKMSPAMILARNEQIEDNKDTSIEEFLAETLEDCENDKATNKLIVVNDLRIQFDTYCSQNKLKNAYNKRKFNEKLKALGLIIKDSNSKVLLYGKRFKDPDEKDM